MLTICLLFRAKNNKGSRRNKALTRLKTVFWGANEGVIWFRKPMLYPTELRAQSVIR